MKTYEPGLGEDISTTAKTIVSMANESGEEVTAKFNDAELFAHPGDDPSMIADKFRAELARRQEEYEASPEGKESRKRQEEAQRQANKAAAEGIKPFEIIDQPGWDKTVTKNTDGYGSCVVRYAARWAWLMEQRIAEGSTVADIAKQTGHDADREGITGFMYGCAVGILAQVWKHGEALRCWHNIDTQCGNEGEKANESGGVLNPAILNISPKE